MLEISDLHLSYGPRKILHGISMSVPDSTIVALIGSNGAGKTTTLRAILGLARPSTGAILLKGERIEALDTAEIVRRGIAVSPEGRRVFPFLSVRENLQIGAYLRPDRRAVQRNLERMFTYFPRLAERRHQAAGSLSGGEQQMLAISRALMAEPSLLLLDEPSLGLAPLIVSEIARIIVAIQREQGLSVILVEQNANMALRLCNHAYVLEKGQVLMEGAGRDLLASEFVRKSYLGV